MIDPNNITKFDRTEEELEEFLLFSILVAGKNSNIQAKKLSDFLSMGSGEECKFPFTYLKLLDYLNSLEKEIKKYKFGQYSRILPCFREIVERFKDKLSTVTLEELLSVKGIGLKTAKLFLVHSRENYRGAVLDTHLMKYMRQMGYEDAPQATPPPKQYLIWEQKFLDLYDKHWQGMSVAEADLTIWKQMRDLKKETA